MFSYLNRKVVPRIYSRRKGGAAHVFTCHGVVKCKSAAPEGGFAFIIAAAVFTVTQKRHFAGGKLNSYLVGATCVQLYENEGGVVVTVQNAVLQRCLFDAFALSRNHKALVFSGVFKKKILKNALFFLGTAFYNGKILLGKGALRNQRGELTGTLLRLCQYHNAACAAV